MKLTNKYNLPQQWVNIVTKIVDKYDRGSARFSGSQLPKPIQQTILLERHGHKVVKDVSNLVWTTFGSMWHMVFEMYNPSQCLQEERLYLDVNGTEISGKFDLYDGETGLLLDHKTTSVYTIMNEERDEWTAQLNIYAEMLRNIGFGVSKLQCLVMARDHRRGESKRISGYPMPISTVDIELWQPEKTRAYIETRVSLLVASSAYADHMLPECSDAERWAKPAVYAVMAKGAKRSKKNCSSEQEARHYIDEHKLVGAVIEHRPGEWMRCESEEYCDAWPWCRQYQEYKESKK